MKTVLVLADVVLAACTAAPPDPGMVPPPPKQTVFSACGWAPEDPPLKVTTASATEVTFPGGMWNDHINWVATTQSWTKCAAPLVVAACAAAPTIPAWDIVKHPDGSQTGPWRFVSNVDGTTSVFVLTAAWTNHETWVAATETWTTCAEATVP